MPYEDIGFAKVDHHRALRKGFPEVVFGQGKSPEQIAHLIESLWIDNAPLKKTLIRCLCIDPSKRMTARELASEWPAISGEDELILANS